MKQQIQRIKNHNFANIDSQLLKNMSSVETLAFTLGSLKQIKSIMDAGIRFSSENHKKQFNYQQGERIHQEQSRTALTSNKGLKLQYGAQTDSTILSKILESASKSEFLLLNQNSPVKMDIKSYKLKEIKYKIEVLKRNYQKVASFLPVLVQTTHSVFKSFSNSYSRLAQKSTNMEENMVKIQEQLIKLKKQNESLVRQNKKLKKQCEQWNQARKRRSIKTDINRNFNEKLFTLDILMPFNSVQLSDVDQNSKQGFQSIASSSSKVNLLSQAFMTKKKRSDYSHNNDLNTARSTSQSQRVYSNQRRDNKNNQKAQIRYEQGFKKERHPLTAIIQNHQDATLQFLNKKRLHNHFKSVVECFTNQHDYEPQPKILRKRSQKKKFDI